MYYITVYCKQLVPIFFPLILEWPTTASNNFLKNSINVIVCWYQTGIRDSGKKA